MYIYFICMHFIKCKFEGHLVMHFIIYNYFKGKFFVMKAFSVQSCAVEVKSSYYIFLYTITK